MEVVLTDFGPKSRFVRIFLRQKRSQKRAIFWTTFWSIFPKETPFGTLSREGHFWSKNRCKKISKSTSLRRNCTYFQKRQKRSFLWKTRNFSWFFCVTVANRLSALWTAHFDTMIFYFNFWRRFGQHVIANVQSGVQDRDCERVFSCSKKTEVFCEKRALGSNFAIKALFWGPFLTIFSGF